MGVRSGSADRRRAALAAACIAIAAAACTATSPPPLPPRRVAFPEQAAPSTPPAAGATVVTWPIDLPAAAEAPSRSERYMGWTLAADAVSLVALARWTGNQNDLYLLAPWLLLTPAVHVAHGELHSAAISVAMRTAALGALYLAGRAAEDECGSSEICIPLGTFVLIELGLVLPIVVDATLLARTTRPAEEWSRLPLLGAAVDAGGRRLFTLTAQF